MRLPVMTVSVRPNDVGVVDEACSAATGCGSTGLLSVVLLVVVVAFLAFFLAAALTHIHEARSIVAAERERAVAERDAFNEFVERIAEIEAAPTPAVEAAGTVSTLTTTSADRSLERAREAYRETVMAVPHFESEYDESLEQNMGAEFGEEVAAAVAGNGQFTPQVKQTLLAGSREASRRRNELITDLDEEAETLIEAEETLGEVDATVESVSRGSIHTRPFSKLMETWERLHDLEDRCRTVIEDRQDELHDSPGPVAFDAPSLQEYLYGDLDVDYPVVSDGTTLLCRVREARADVVDAISRRA